MNMGSEREEQMVNLEYHKGELCAHSAILCQEGFCSECIIFLEKRQKATPRFIKIKSPVKLNIASNITIGGTDQKRANTIQRKR